MKQLVEKYCQMVYILTLFPSSTIIGGSEIYNEWFRI